MPFELVGVNTRQVHGAFKPARHSARFDRIMWFDRGDQGGGCVGPWDRRPVLADIQQDLGPCRV